MFIGSGGEGQKVREAKDGLWGLDRATPQYRAWQYWRALEFGCKIYPKALTTTGQWPPTTVGGARAYAAWLSGIRDEVKNDTGVPRHPDPWDGTIPPPPIEEETDETA